MVGERHLGHDVGTTGEAGLAEGHVHLEALVVLLQLEEGVGGEHLAQPHVGQAEALQLCMPTGKIMATVALVLHFMLIYLGVR